jgi:hypothetical protein
MSGIFHLQELVADQSSNSLEWLLFILVFEKICSKMEHLRNLVEAKIRLIAQ